MNLKKLLLKGEEKIVLDLSWYKLDHGFNC